MWLNLIKTRQCYILRNIVFLKLKGKIQTNNNAHTDSQLKKSGVNYGKQLHVFDNGLSSTSKSHVRDCLRGFSNWLKQHAAFTQTQLIHLYVIITHTIGDPLRQRTDTNSLYKYWVINLKNTSEVKDVPYIFKELSKKENYTYENKFCYIVNELSILLCDGSSSFRVRLWPRVQTWSIW